MERSLSEYGFSHGISKEHRDSRRETHKVFAQAVREGRKKYGDLAWTHRQGDMDSNSDDEDNEEEEDDSEDAPAVADVGAADDW